MEDGTPVLVRLPEVNFLDDQAGKPVGINEVIGRRTIAAFGNSDSDLQMLQWTTADDGGRFGLIVDHDDDACEYAHDRHSHCGKLDQALAAAGSAGWIVASMRHDWTTVFQQPAT